MNEDVMNEDVMQEVTVLCLLKPIGDRPAGAVVSWDEAVQMAGRGRRRVTARIGITFGLRELIVAIPPGQLEIPVCRDRGALIRTLTPEEIDARANREAEASAQRKAAEQAAVQERVDAARQAEASAKQALATARKARRTAEASAR